MQCINKSNLDINTVKEKLVARYYENSFSMTEKYTNASMNFNSKGTNIIKFLSKI